MATINFNVSEVSPAQDYKPLPEGKYEAVIAESDPRSFKEVSNRYLLMAK